MRSQRLPAWLVLAATMGLIAVGAGTLAAASPRDEQVKREMKALAGRWETIASEAGGEHIEAPRGSRPDVRIEGDHYDTVYPAGPDRGPKVGGTRFTVDPTADPKSIDFLPATDAENAPDASRPSRGIYKLDKDTLWICFNPVPGGERPTEFATKAGSRVRCITLKRKAPTTAPAR